METRFIKPTPGYQVRMPNGNVLPADGVEVEMNSYWLRRLEDNDVIEAEKLKGKKS